MLPKWRLFTWWPLWVSCANRKAVPFMLCLPPGIAAAYIMWWVLQVTLPRSRFGGGDAGCLLLEAPASSLWKRAERKRKKRDLAEEAELWYRVCGCLSWHHREFWGHPYWGRMKTACPQPLSLLQRNSLTSLTSVMLWQVEQMPWGLHSTGAQWYRVYLAHMRF